MDLNHRRMVKSSVQQDRSQSGPEVLDLALELKGHLIRPSLSLR